MAAKDVVFGGEARARMVEGVNILANAVKEVGRRATTGEPVQEAELAALTSRVAQSNNAELGAALDDGVDTLRFMQQFKTLPLPAQEQAVDQMRQEIAGSPPSLLDKGRTAKRLKAAEEMLTKAQGEIKRNPLAWEGRVGMTQVVPLGTVDLNAAGALEQWGAQRIAQADNAAARHGLPAVPYLEPTEQRALAKAFEQGGQQGLAAVTYVRRAFGDKAETVLAQIGKEAPAGALPGQLALTTGTTSAVLDAAEGLTGWVCGEDAGRSLPVALWISGEEVARTVPSGLRPDLWEGGLPEAPSAFAFRLERLLPLLRAAGGASVVFMSSGGMYSSPLVVDDIEYRHGYNGVRAYARTKKMQVVLADSWARRLAGTDIRVESMHPGWVETPGVAEYLPRFRIITKPLLRNVVDGADTAVWLVATRPPSKPGHFWHDRSQRPTTFGWQRHEDPAKVRRFLAQVSRLTGTAEGWTGLRA